MKSRIGLLHNGISVVYWITPGGFFFIIIWNCLWVRITVVRVLWCTCNASGQPHTCMLKCWIHESNVIPIDIQETLRLLGIKHKPAGEYSVNNCSLRNFSKSKECEHQANKGLGFFPYIRLFPDFIRKDFSIPCHFSTMYSNNTVMSQTIGLL